MTLTRSSLTPYLAALLVFAALFGVLKLLDRGTAAPGTAAPVELGAGGEPAGRPSTDETIRSLQTAVRQDPRDATLRGQLGQAYLQKVRETGDPAYYGRADGVLRSALATDPRNFAALNGASTLALARHDFSGGLALAQRALRTEPELVAPLYNIVDGEIELGRYDAAGRTLQRLVDLKPSLAAYARVSYWRELHGDLDGAASAMALAVSAGGGTTEANAYVKTLLGNLEFQRGQLAAARRAYGDALAGSPGYVPAQVGLGRLDASAGRFAPAISRLRSAVTRLPLPENVIALGETELAAGRVAAARRDLALVGAERRLLAAAGVNTDVDIALFEANHGSPARAVGLARRAWAAAPSVRSADALGWALTRSGRAADGLVWMQRALRLGWRDPLVRYHAGMAAKAAGRPVLARRWLRDSLARNPAFSPLYAPRARAALRALS